MQRNVQAVLIALVILILGCELAARLTTGLNASSAAAERASFLARIPGGTAGESEFATRRFVDMFYGARYELHPFFGYTYFRDYGGANNQGFMSGGSDYPYRREPDEFVIGIFGGSVAMQVAGIQELIVEPIAKALADKGYRRVTMLSFAVGGWRQPQSFNALVYFLRSIDMAILVDGFNEVVQLSPGHMGFYPAAYPPSDVYGALASDAGDPRSSAKHARLIVLNELAAAVTHAMSHSAFSSSVFLHSVWRVLASAYQSTVSGIRSERRREIGKIWSEVEPIATTEEIALKRAAYFRLYEDVLRDADLILRDEGKTLFHFVQPNQYNRGSKPLSRVEEEQYTSQDWSDTVTSGYVHLEAMVGALRRDGIDSLSLADVFRDLEETAYVDDCCHLNERGLSILNRSIVGQILQSRRFREIPDAHAARPDVDRRQVARSERLAASR